MPLLQIFQSPYVNIVDGSINEQTISRFWNDVYTNNASFIIGLSEMDKDYLYMNHIYLKNREISDVDSRKSFCNYHWHKFGSVEICISPHYLECEQMEISKISLISFGKSKIVYHIKGTISKINEIIHIIKTFKCDNNNCIMVHCNKETESILMSITNVELNKQLNVIKKIRSRQYYQSVYLY